VGLGCAAFILWALSGEIGRFVGRSAIEGYYEGERQGLVEKGQEIAAKELRKQLPVQVDERTILQNVLSVGKTLQYHYRMQMTKGDIDYHNFHRDMSGKLKNYVCLEKNMRFTLDNGGAFKYIYTGSDGLLIDQITITSSVC